MNVLSSGGMNDRVRLERDGAIARVCLARGERRLAKRFFRAAGRVVDQAWDMAIGGDLALPEVPGHRGLGLRISNGYAERILRAAEHDPVVAAVFGDVSDLVAPPQELVRPSFLWRVLLGNLGRTVATPDPVQPAEHQSLVLELSRRAVTKPGHTER